MHSFSHSHHGSGHPSLTEGSIWKGLLSFAFPLFLGNLFQQLYNTADTWLVGNFLSKEALAAVSSSFNLIFLLIGLLNGIAMGAGVVIAKYYGAKDWKQLHIAIHTDLAFGVLGGLVLTVVGVILTPHILRWMGTPAEVLPNSIAYFRTYFLGVLATFLYNISTGILQAVGDSRHPLYYLMFSSVVNVGLDLLFVAHFHWGVASAAAATVISQALSALLCLRRLLGTREVYRVTPREIRLDPVMLRRIIRFGFPSGIQNSVIGFANVLVQSNINAFGSDAMAGCGSYAKLEGFAFLPVTCFAMALATYVGQNLGAQRLDRVRKGARFGILCSVLLTEVIGVLFFLFAEPLISLFSGDPQVIAFGVQQTRTESLFFCMLALSHCYAGVFRGAGKASVPMLVMLACWCLVRVSYITVMVRVFQNIAVIFTAYPLTWSLSSVIFTAYYFRADWIHAFQRLEQAGKA